MIHHLLPDEADDLQKGRVQVINLWRPIKGPLLDSPLAVCDATTIALDDLVPSDLVYPHRVGETYSVRFNPAHRWYYVPKMRTDEALLLKCCDTSDAVPARYPPHSAFTDPTAPADAPPRAACSHHDVGATWEGRPQQASGSRRRPPPAAPAA